MLKNMLQFKFSEWTVLKTMRLSKKIYLTGYFFWFSFLSYIYLLQLLFLFLVIIVNVLFLGNQRLAIILWFFVGLIIYVFVCILKTNTSYHKRNRCLSNFLNSSLFNLNKFKMAQLCKWVSLSFVLVWDIYYLSVLNKHTYVSPLLKLKGCEFDSNEKLFWQSNADVGGLTFEAFGHSKTSIILTIFGTKMIKYCTCITIDCVS